LQLHAVVTNNQDGRIILYETLRATRTTENAAIIVGGGEIGLNASKKLQENIANREERKHSTSSHVKL